MTHEFFFCRYDNNKPLSDNYQLSKKIKFSIDRHRIFRHAFDKEETVSVLDFQRAKYSKIEGLKIIENN